MSAPFDAEAVRVNEVGFSNLWCRSIAALAALALALHVIVPALTVTAPRSVTIAGVVVTICSQSDGGESSPLGEHDRQPCCILCLSPALASAPAASWAAPATGTAASRPRLWSAILPRAPPERDPLQPRAPPSA